MQAEELNYRNEKLYYLVAIFALAGLAITISLFVWPENGIRLGTAAGCVIGSVLLGIKWARDTNKAERMNKQIKLLDKQELYPPYGTSTKEVPLSEKIKPISDEATILFNEALQKVYGKSLAELKEEAKLKSKPKMTNIIGSVWERKTPNGKNYMEMNLGIKRYLIVPNTNKLKPEQEDWLVSEVPNVDQMIADIQRGE
jgi:hypothetical protein